VIRNVRRPDLNQIEFWSGTENDIRSKPLTAPTPAKAADTAPSPAVPTGALMPLGASAQPATAVPAPVKRSVLTLAAPAEVKKGDIFSVSVNLKSEQALRGIPVQILYDKNVLEVIGADEGAFFKSDGAAISNTKVLEQTSGRAAIAVMRDAGDGVKGDGTAVSFRFKAIGTGVAEINIAPTKVIALEPAEPPLLPPAAKVTVK
jgi:general secretion pathway protein D